MHWKMSIDLSHPAVASMGNLDPYDGLVTYSLLQALAERSGEFPCNKTLHAITALQQGHFRVSHPAVASMCNLDPYDGLVTYSLLQGLAERHGELCWLSRLSCALK